MRRKTPEKRETKRRTGPAEDTAGQGQPLDLLRLDQYRQEAGQARQAVNAAYPLRLDTPQAWKEWQAAVHHQYEVYQNYADVYFQPPPLSGEDAQYGWDFWRDIELLRGGDSTKLESAVAFLEADPWFHRSGYAKVKMARYIKQAMLTPGYVARLQNVVLAMVEQRNGQEFRAYCRLARKVDSPELREKLKRRFAHDDANVRRRARWVLEALGQNQPKEKRQ